MHKIISVILLSSFVLTGCLATTATENEKRTNYQNMLAGTWLANNTDVEAFKTLGSDVQKNSMALAMGTIGVPEDPDQTYTAELSSLLRGKLSEEKETRESWEKEVSDATSDIPWVGTAIGLLAFGLQTFRKYKSDKKALVLYKSTRKVIDLAKEKQFGDVAVEIVKNVHNVEGMRKEIDKDLTKLRKKQISV